MPLPTAVSGRLPDAATFAGVLAALTDPGPRPQPASPDAAPGWLDDLDDDVALLSYERALKAHGRCRTGESAGLRLPPLPAADLPDEDSAPNPRKPEGTADLRAAGSPPGRASRALEDRRKRASVTVRMSLAECGQLQQRSTEAGLTVSAYLRSCAFEVDSLRAQVKQALAELRAVQPAAREPAPRTRPWWSRIFRRARLPQSA